MSYPRVKRNKVKDKSLINKVKNFMWCYNSFSLIVFYIYIKYNFSVLKFFAFCLYNSTTGRPQHHSKQKNKVPKEHKTKNDRQDARSGYFFFFYHHVLLYNIIILIAFIIILQTFTLLIKFFFIQTSYMYAFDLCKVQIILPTKLVTYL